MRVWGVRFGVEGLRWRVWGEGRRVQSVGCKPRQRRLRPVRLLRPCTHS